MEGIFPIVWCQNIADFHQKNVSKDKLCTFIHLKEQILADSFKFMFSYIIQAKLNQNLLDLAKCLLKFLAKECCCNNHGLSLFWPPHNTQPPLTDLIITGQ